MKSRWRLFAGTMSLLLLAKGQVWVHVGILDRRQWKWGRSTEPYDLCAEYFGLGPFFLIVWDGGTELRSELSRMVCGECRRFDVEHAPDGTCLFQPTRFVEASLAPTRRQDAPGTWAWFKYICGRSNDATKDR
jgi:hypothetical protein